MADVVDNRSRRVSRSASGGWTAALFIIGVGIAERFAFYGVSANVISYLTGPLRLSIASAAVGLNWWNGIASLLPLLGAFLADSYIGRYRTILHATLLYVLGLGMLSLSTVLSSLHSSTCGGTSDASSCPPSPLQTSIFYIALYLVAFAQGGHKPCVQAFGAEQFDEYDPDESVSRSTFFNWCYFGMSISVIVTLTILIYIQDNISWAVGFGIPSAVMLCALILFLLGTRTYRFYPMQEESPFSRIGRTLVFLVRNQFGDSNLPGSIIGERDRHIPNAQNLDEAKGLLRLFPIWETCLIYAVVFSQSSTLFTKQGSTLDRRIGAKLQVPPAALQSFISASTMAFIPIYDQLLVPFARRFSKLPSGITMLQRIGTGILIFIVSMVIAALMEMRRMQIAKDYHLVDQPKAMVPMGFWWLAPQYILFGIADVFTVVGLQELFYDQVPNAMRSLGLAFYLSIFGVGSFISGFLISVIDKSTSKRGESWFSNNLNRAHLDYFYWLLAGMSTTEFILFIYFAKSYAYKKKVATLESNSTL